jgi:hypothetical protein
VKAGWVLQTPLGSRERGATRLAATAQRSRTARGVRVSFFLSFFFHYIFIFFLFSFFLSFFFFSAALLLFLFMKQLLIADSSVCDHAWVRCTSECGCAPRCDAYMRTGGLR